MSVNVPTKNDLLEELDFGSVDAESEEELAKLFVQTQDFTNISEKRNCLFLAQKVLEKVLYLGFLLTIREKQRRSWVTNFQKTHILLKQLEEMISKV